MFFNFGAVARLPLVESNAIAFSSPLFTVALAALILGERVRVYRWSAVVVGFVGVLVVLSHLSGDELTAAIGGATSLIGVVYAICGRLQTPEPRFKRDARRRANRHHQSYFISH